VTGCLHLKTAVTGFGGRRVLLNPEWVDVRSLGDVDPVEVHPSEPMGANVLPVGDTVLYPSAFPRTLERLQAAGARVRCVDASEVAKAEGALTCCSLIFEA